MTGSALAVLSLAPAPLVAQEPGQPPEGQPQPVDTRPPETRLYFEAPASSPFLAPLLAQHGCSVPEGKSIRVVMPGRMFEPPVQLTADAAAGRSDPLASMATQWALLAAGDAERAVDGWVTEERATAEVLLSDPAAMERYRSQAEAIDGARVDALVWFEDETGETPVASLIAAGNPTGFTLGMPGGLRRDAEGEFRLSIAIARDARFAIVGAAAREGAFAAVGADGAEGEAADVVRYAEACR